MSTTTGLGNPDCGRVLLGGRGAGEFPSGTAWWVQLPKPKGEFDEIRSTHCNHAFRPSTDGRRRRRRQGRRRRHRLRLSFSRASLGLIRDAVRTVWGWHGGALTIGSSLPAAIGMSPLAKQCRIPKICDRGQTPRYQHRVRRRKISNRRGSNRSASNGRLSRTLGNQCARAML